MRALEGAAEVLEFPLPAVITVDEGLNKERLPSLKGIMAAKKKPLETKPAQLGTANVGDTPTLSFWTKGDVSPTGNVMFSLAYMSAGNQRLYESGHQFFQGQLKGDGWTQITFQGGAIPVGTSSLFLEINTAVGPLEGGRINVVPVDWLVDAMDHIAHKPRLDGHCFHLTDPEPRRIAITGMETHVCVLQTALGLLAELPAPGNSRAAPGLRRREVTRRAGCGGGSPSRPRAS